LPQHVQEVVRQDSHKQPSLIGCEAMATGLVLYDPEFYLNRSFEYLSRMESTPPKKTFALPSISVLRAVFITLFRQGLLYPSRLTFWKFFLRGLQRFPRWFRYFLSACVLAEPNYGYRRTIEIELETHLAQSFRSETLPDSNGMPRPGSLPEKT
jgi:hypothetical protein